MKISRTYYIRNPKNLGKADAEFQASWGLKRKDDDIKYIRADLVKELEEVSRIISEYINPNQVVFVKYGARMAIYERLQQALKALEG